ncbi:PqqD family protein [Halalkalibacter okhensis]|uniref:Pyrroloquinoline quinone biosynthesis protein PqqD n=1 Tax=Halalkalibacter okhensis TaxID=333138 RepID=A0A0B0IDQ9_9BACI|nr:PqqD family protein [Halalkalibacter okhensis]KHF37801.1 hypothetical protein LQ50_25250 [Halalkalibacter okhensis]
MKNEKPVLDYSVKIRKVDDILYAVKRNNAWEINDVTKEMMRRCNGEKTIVEIAEEIAEFYKTDKKEVLMDCEKIFGYFIQEKLLILT